MSKIYYTAYSVSTKKDGSNHWQKLGNAFPFEAKDGKLGINIPNMNIVIMPSK